MKLLGLVVFLLLIQLYKRCDKLPVLNLWLIIFSVGYLMVTWSLQWYISLVLGVLMFNAYCDIIYKQVYVPICLLQLVISLIVFAYNFDITGVIVAIVLILLSFVKAYAIADGVMLASCVLLGGHSYVDLGLIFFMCSAINFLVIAIPKKIYWRVKGIEPQNMDFTASMLIAFIFIYVFWWHILV